VLTTKRQLVPNKEIKRISNEIIEGGVKKLEQFMYHEPEKLMLGDEHGRTIWHQLASMSTEAIKLKLMESKLIRELKDNIGWSVEQELAWSGSENVRSNLLIFSDSDVVKNYIVQTLINLIELRRN